MVAVVALRLARLRHCRLLHLPDRSNRRDLPHWVPRRWPGVVWHLGEFVARLQQSRNGCVPSTSPVKECPHTDIISNLAAACIWYGVQSYIGGHCVYIMIRAIWTSWVSKPSQDSLLTISDILARTVTSSPTRSRKAPARQQPITPRSSSSGSAHYPPSGSPSTKSAISSRSRPTLSPLPALPSSSGPLSAPVVSVPSSTSKQPRRDRGSRGSSSRA